MDMRGILFVFLVAMMMGFRAGAEDVIAPMGISPKPSQPHDARYFDDVRDADGVLGVDPSASQNLFVKFEPLILLGVGLVLAVGMTVCQQRQGSVPLDAGE